MGSFYVKVPGLCAQCHQGVLHHPRILQGCVVYRGASVVVFHVDSETPGQHVQHVYVLVRAVLQRRHNVVDRVLAVLVGALQINVGVAGQEAHNLHVVGLDRVDEHIPLQLIGAVDVRSVVDLEFDDLRVLAVALDQKDQRRDFDRLAVNHALEGGVEVGAVCQPLLQHVDVFGGALQGQGEGSLLIGVLLVDVAAGSDQLLLQCCEVALCGLVQRGAFVFVHGLHVHAALLERVDDLRYQGAWGLHALHREYVEQILALRVNLLHYGVVAALLEQTVDEAELFLEYAVFDGQHQIELVLQQQVGHSLPVEFDRNLEQRVVALLERAGTLILLLLVVRILAEPSEPAKPAEAEHLVVLDSEQSAVVAELVVPVGLLFHLVLAVGLLVREHCGVLVLGLFCGLLSLLLLLVLGLHHMGCDHRFGVVVQQHYGEVLVLVDEGHRQRGVAVLVFGLLVRAAFDELPRADN